MCRRKYPKVTGVLYTKNLREGSGRFSWSMLEAKYGNHYKCADCNIAIIKANPTWVRDIKNLRW